MKEFAKTLLLPDSLDVNVACQSFSNIQGWETRYFAMFPSNISGFLALDVTSSLLQVPPYKLGSLAIYLVLQLWMLLKFW